MSHGSTALPQGAAQGRGSTLSLYEIVAAEVGDDTDGSAIIQRIVALSQAAADGHTAEICEREEADVARSQEHDLADKPTGSIDGGTVLARVSAQPHVDHAPTDTS